jgi:AraC-like DNA-binding protein
MKDIIYEFVNLDTDENFQQLGKSFGGTFRNNALQFDNQIVKGELIKRDPEPGLWLRKWTFTVLEKIVLRKMPETEPAEKKFCLVYFLNPSLFSLRNKARNFNVTSHQNSLFFSSDATMDFSVVPKQPFYCLDIAFTASWVLKQFEDADEVFKTALKTYLDKCCGKPLFEPCCKNEFQTLHQLETSMHADQEDFLFIRSNVYKLVLDFFRKLFNRNEASVVESAVHYNQIMKAKMLIASDVRKQPKVKVISREVNMSISSLLRQFKLIYGKSIQEYCVETKMDFAKTLLLKNRITVKEIAEMLGYKQASSFIEIFTKHHGCSPGALQSVLT